MTHIETARVNEALGLQIGIIRDLARRLDPQELEQLETDLTELEKATRELKGLLESLPHRRG